MPEERIIWRNKKAAGIYHREVARENPGVIDENYIKNYIISKRKVKVVSLGIGVGRELYWLDKLNNIKEVVGIDYSQEMLDFCKEITERYKIKVTLIKDDLLSLKKFKNLIRNEKYPLIYICLINTFGDFEEEERVKILKNLKYLIKKKDRLILSLNKRPETIKARTFLPLQIRSKGNSTTRFKLKTAIEYMFYEFFWPPLLERYHRLPRFWYDDKTNNITIYIGKKKILISHRFSKEEIKKLSREAKLKIEKLIEGKFMWVVILKI